MAKIEVKVVIDLSNAEQTAAMNNLIKALSTGESGQMGVQSPEPTQEAKPEATSKRTRSPKPAAPEALKPEPAKEPEVEEKDENEGGSEQQVKIKDVREALSEKVDQHRAAIKAKLTSLGASNVTSLDPAHYVEMFNFLKGLKNG